MWKHPQTGRFYWRVSSSLVPAGIRGKGKFTNVPLVPNGQATATRARATADACRARMWRDFRRQGAKPAAKGIDSWNAPRKLIQVV